MNNLNSTERKKKLLDARNLLQEQLDRQHEILCTLRTEYWESSEQFQRQQSHFNYLQNSYWEEIESVNEKVYWKQLKLFTTIAAIALSSLFAQAQDNYQDIKQSNPDIINNMHKELSQPDWHWLLTYNVSDSAIRENNPETADEVLYAWNIEFLKVILTSGYSIEPWDDTKLLIKWLGKNLRIITWDVELNWSVLTGKRTGSHNIDLYMDEKQIWIIWLDDKSIYDLDN